ncbi:MAG TPA: UbiA family prenyltransferase, partial [Methanomassiliicoccales archaeon]|nr:UbiA family prenyltransferase [Methanomassiliicoccales archaeon]
MAEDAGLSTRITERIDRFVAWLEKDRLSIVAIFFYVLAVAVIRDLLEYFLLDQTFVTTAHPWIFSIAHHVSFYVVIFLGLIFLLTAFSGRSARKCTNFVVMFWWIIILPPIIDHFIFGLNTNYAYFSITDFINAFFHFSGETFHPGQAMEVIVILFALFAYTIWTQRASWYSIKGRGLLALRVVFLVFFTILAMFIMATPATFLPVGFVDGSSQFPAYDLTRYYQYHLFLLGYYLIAGIVISLAIYYFAMKGNFRNVVRSMRPAQSLFFGAIVAAGIVTGWTLDSGLDLVTKIFQYPFYVNLPFFGIAIIAALVGWQVSTIWNDLSDARYDERRPGRLIASGTLPPRYLAEFSVVLASITLMLSALLSLLQLLIMVAILVLAFAYSFRPIRFKTHLLSPLMIGLGTFLAFLYGYLTPYSEVASYVQSGQTFYYVTGLVFEPKLVPEGFAIAFLMFLGLVIGSMVMDVRGYDEDRAAGVKTIYTVAGK